MASTLDLLPTILKIVDIQPKKDVTLDGYDMGPILFNNGSVSAAHKISSVVNARVASVMRELL